MRSPTAARRKTSAIVTLMLRGDTNAAAAALRDNVDDHRDVADILSASLNMLMEAWRIHARRNGVNAVDLAETQVQFYLRQEEYERSRQ